MDEIFIATPPGLEAITLSEIRALGYHPKPVKGGFVLGGDLKAIYRLNLHLRTASRVLGRLGDFHAAAFSELHKKASRLPWEKYIKPGQPVAIRVASHHSRLFHSDGIAERIGKALKDRLGQDSEIKKQHQSETDIPVQMIHVRISNNYCTVSLDTSGALLHQRGYRLETGKAPLRENLAAALILAAGWDQQSALIDPFCGAGTIPIEAALLARNLPPGMGRQFAFMDWLNYDKPAFKQIIASARLKTDQQTSQIYGSDRDQGAIESAKLNAARAGVPQDVQFQAIAFSQINAASATGWIITNPPYGARVGAEKDIRNLYAQIGNVLRKNFCGWKVGILTNEISLLRQTGLKLETALQFSNGGISVQFALGTVK